MKMTIDTLAVFTHSSAERAALDHLIRAFGPESSFTHGKTRYVEPTDVVIAGYRIKYLGVRDPDETRSQVGYADFAVENFSDLQAAATERPYLSNMTSGRDQALIEFRHPDYDVLAYAVSADEH